MLQASTWDSCTSNKNDSSGFWGPYRKSRTGLVTAPSPERNHYLDVLKIHQKELSPKLVHCSPSKGSPVLASTHLLLVALTFLFPCLKIIESLDSSFTFISNIHSTIPKRFSLCVKLLPALPGDGEGSSVVASLSVYAESPLLRTWAHHPGIFMGALVLCVHKNFVLGQCLPTPHLLQIL